MASSSPPNAVVTEGFEKRILWKTASAGTAGAALGAFLALGKKTKVLPASLTGAASLGMLSLAFTGAQEYTRALTSSDTPINAAVGGAASGALLFASYGSRPVYGAAIMAALGCSADILFRVLSFSSHSRQEDKPSFWDKIVRKTTDEEREAFLQDRRRRILREDLPNQKNANAGHAD
ncbi:hypothetical protein M9435_000933 [Picochlorum sp. BPE23]|nr:hypothetical protein M9435_000933 [Picochlorum sp. BPE23]